MIEKLRLSLVWIAITAVVLIGILLVQNNYQNNIAQAKKHFIESNHAATVGELAKLETAVRSIYENIRTLASLPSVRSIDRHAKNLSGEAHVTFQQIYNNLAYNVDVSEVYIVPIDFAPDKMDPITLKPEEPILMYDELILNANQGLVAVEGRAVSEVPQRMLPEVESFEYTQLVDHAAWLKAHYSKAQDVRGLKVPFISGPEVITCDNRVFNETGHDPDRSGIMFSVPFYGQDGEIKGMISAIILTSALRDLLPLQNFALVNPGNNYANLAKGAGEMISSVKFIKEGKVDPNLIYSEVVALSVVDVRSPWALWSGLPDAYFWNGKEAQLAEKTRLNALALLAALALIASIITFLVDRYLRQTAALANSNMKTRFLAEQAEAEARESAEKFKSLSEDIARLNGELSQKIVELTVAQDDIIRKGKMAQLGNLIATVAHELRNPLGGVRTTAFMLRRKLKSASIDVDDQLKRIDSGVARCDGIISQLLDFARTQPLATASTDIEAWLLKVVTETSQDLPQNVAIQLIFEAPNLMVEIDSERLRRGIVNLVNNASEALTEAPDKNLLPTKPQITICLKRSDRGAEILVLDNGPGMSAETIEKINDALFTTKSFGTGLGLAAVRKIVELHGGGLDIVSELGKGACFAMWLPVHSQSVKAA